MIMRNICVFCGSSHGLDPTFTEEAKSLGHHLVSNNFALVYGGGSIGLMGEIADAVLEKDGEVIGVIPDFLAHKEVDHKGITKMYKVESMHERKNKMVEISDAFIAMPGGFGTFEELFEILTWAQLGLVKKPIALFNVAGYFNPLINMLNTMVTSSFLKQENLDLLVIDSKPAGVLERIMDYKVQKTQKWISRDQT